LSLQHIRRCDHQMSDQSSAEKKRNRDRRAQQNLRDKKLRYTNKLEAQVAHCEQHHNDTGVQELLGIIDSLRRQNECLVARQRSLRLLISSWDEKQQVSDDLSPNQPKTLNTTSEQIDHSLLQTTYPPLETADSSNKDNYLTYHVAPSTPTIPSQQTPGAIHPISINSPWNELPLYSDKFTSIQTVSLPWLVHPTEITKCPDTPESPLDILYGSKTNLLANMIHIAMERRPIRDPERLAMGWITYHFTKWIIEPSPKTYANIAPFLRPFQEQFEIKHPIAVCCVPYRGVRANLIRQWSLYEENRDGLFGMFACCIKVRWPWGVKILDRDEDNILRIKPAFLETFMREEGWGLTQEFINTHPNLMIGMDLDSVVFDIV